MKDDTKARIAGAVVVAGIAAYFILSSGDQLDVVVRDTASAGVKETVAAAWPKVLQACHGLTSFQADIEFAGVEDNYGYAEGRAKRIEVMFRVAESPRMIPPEYRAGGHVCYFSISPDGSRLTISKRPCASVCLAQPFDGEFSRPL